MNMKFYNILNEYREFRELTGNNFPVELDESYNLFSFGIFAKRSVLLLLYELFTDILTDHIIIRFMKESNGLCIECNNGSILKSKNFIAVEDIRAGSLCAYKMQLLLGERRNIIDYDPKGKSILYYRFYYRELDLSVISLVINNDNKELEKLAIDFILWLYYNRANRWVRPRFFSRNQKFEMYYNSFRWSLAGDFMLHSFLEEIMNKEGIPYRKFIWLDY